MPKREQNISASTTHNATKEREEGKFCVDLFKTGRLRILNNARKQRRIEAAKSKVGVSSQALAGRFNVSKMASLSIFARNDLVFRKRRKAYKYTLPRLEMFPRYVLRKNDFILSVN